MNGGGRCVFLESVLLNGAVGQENLCAQLIQTAVYRHGLGNPEARSGGTDAHGVGIIEVERDGGPAMAQAAGTLGYNITIEELERAAAEMEALDDEELDVVAAGQNGRRDANCIKDPICVRAHQRLTDEKGHDVWCVTAWHCIAVTLHTDADARVACWSNKACVWVNE